jgi:O-antigen ligase
MIFVVLGALFLYFINFTNAGIQLWFGLQYGIHASSVGTRQVLWSQAIQQINEQPFGNGVIWRNDPHDIVLKSFRDLGILFGAIFLLMIFYPTSYILRFKLFTTSRKSVAILIAYLSVMIHSLIEIFYLTSTSIIWVVMVLTYLSVTLKNEKKVKNTIKNSKQQIVEKAS